MNDTVEALKKLFTFCKRRGVTFKSEPYWKDQQLWLREPDEHERYLSESESDRLMDAMATVREDYEPLMLFSWTSGKREAECMTLRWEHVKWDRQVIERPGKRGRTVQVAITPTIREILWPLRGQHPEFVFIYVAKRTKDGRIRGRRYPITKDGLKGVWKRVREAAEIPTTGPDRFRFHDLRHDFATKLLHTVKAESPAAALKVVQKSLDHASITTTMRYAHVTAEDVATGIEAVAEARRNRRHGNHRKNHRSQKLKAV